jgi:hypothetical protein
MQGREGATALMDRVKVGAIISLTGRVQPHVPAGPSARQAVNGSSATPPPEDEPAADGGDGSNMASTLSTTSSSSSVGSNNGSGSSSSLTVRPQVLDVVVHQLEVLYRNRWATGTWRLRQPSHTLRHVFGSPCRVSVSYGVCAHLREGG